MKREMLTQYEYRLLNESNLDENFLINLIHTDFVCGSSDAYELVIGNVLNKPTLKNFRTIANNLISKYYICHNNKQLKNRKPCQN